MEYRVRLNLLSTAIVVAAGIIVSVVTSTVVAARAYESRARQSAKVNQDITVKGSTRTRVRSDLAVWRIEVKGEGPELADAYAVLDAAAERVKAFLAGAGFAPDEVALSAIDTSTFFARDSQGRETREVSGYALERAFTVTTPQVDRAETAAGAVTELLKDNVKVVSSRPQYYYSKVADLKVQILGDASRDARARAEEIARSSGCRVTDVRRAQMGVIQITQPNSTEVSGYGLYDTSTIDKDVSVVVTLTLGIES